MSFDVDPAEMLVVGIYDVAVTDADGQSAVRPGSLAIVAPPKVDAVVPMNVCVAQGDRVVMVKGSGFLLVSGMAPNVEIYDASGMLLEGYTPTASDCTAIAPALGDYQLCNTLTFTVPVNTTALGRPIAKTDHFDRLARRSPRN